MKRKCVSCTLFCTINVLYSMSFSFKDYKKKMNSLGINVVVDKKEIVLQGDKAAGFDYSTGTIYIRKKVSA